MAAINLENVDWNAVANEVGDHTRNSSGMVDVIRKAARNMLKGDKEYSVAKIKHMLDAALNQDLEEGEEKYDVNWSTIKHALNADGFEEVEKNVYRLNPSAKKQAKKKVKF